MNASVEREYITEIVQDLRSPLAGTIRAVKLLADGQHLLRVSARRADRHDPAGAVAAPLGDGRPARAAPGRAGSRRSTRARRSPIVQKHMAVVLLVLALIPTATLVAAMVIRSIEPRTTWGGSREEGQVVPLAGLETAPEVEVPAVTCGSASTPPGRRRRSAPPGTSRRGGGP